MDLFSKKITSALEILETRHIREEKDNATIYLHRLEPGLPFAVALLTIELQPWFGLVHLSPKTRVTPFDYQKVKFSTIENAVIESSKGTESIKMCTLLTLPSILRESFIQISSELTSLHSRNASEEQLYSVIEAWSEAFLQVAEPTDDEVLGLWGELLAIVESSDSAAMVKAWHGEKHATYDFIFADGSVCEVKTAGHGRRKHGFSSNQIHVGMPTDFTLISIVTLPSDDGLSVSQLKDAIMTKLVSVDSQISFLRKCSKACPPQSKKMNLTWNFKQAQDSIRNYSASALSTPSYVFPVSDVSWSQVFDEDES